MIAVTSLGELAPLLQNMKAVVFDLDDTLYSEKEYVRSGYGAIARAMPEIADMEAKLWSAFLQKQPAIDSVLTDEGLYSEERKQICLAAYRLQQPEIHFYEGVPELLTKLRAEGKKLGIITDGRPEGQRAKIRALGLESYVDHILITDELGGVEFRKPNPAAFLEMQKKLGVTFAEMCYIGDNIQKDFIAPQSLGMESIWFQNPEGLYYHFPGGRPG